MAVDKTKKIVETAALDTLKPGSQGGDTAGKLKSEIMAMAQKMMMTMNDSDLVSFFNSSLAAIGSEAKGVPAGAASHNKDSINAKSTVKEDMQTILADLSLSEDTLERISTLFEAAVTLRSDIVVEEAREQIQSESDEKIEKYMEEAIEEINKYLDTVADEWLTENEVVIESNIKTAISESFIDGLKALFTEHYIDIPDEKVDVVGDLSDTLEKLRADLNESKRENMQLSAMLEEIAVSKIVESMSKELTETQKERFKVLADSVKFDSDNIDAFKNKLNIIKETFVLDKKTSVKSTIAEHTGLEIEEDKKVMTEEEDSSIAAYRRLFKTS